MTDHYAAAERLLASAETQYGADRIAAAGIHAFLAAIQRTDKPAAGSTSDQAARRLDEARWTARNSGYDDAIRAGAEALYVHSGEGNGEWDDADPAAKIGWADDAAVVLAAARPLIEAKVRSVIEQEARAGQVSDGYHTHAELYRDRMLYQVHAVRGWVAAGIPVVKSWKHHDGGECFGGGWFIVTATLITGQVSNHYQEKHWDLFDCPEVEHAPEWDGHTSAAAAERLLLGLQYGGTSDE